MRCAVSLALLLYISKPLTFKTTLNGTVTSLAANLIIGNLEYIMQGRSTVLHITIGEEISRPLNSRQRYLTRRVSTWTETLADTEKKGLNGVRHLHLRIVLHTAIL